jgi:hypothetical protein
MKIGGRGHPYPSTKASKGRPRGGARPRAPPNPNPRVPKRMGPLGPIKEGWPTTSGLPYRRRPNKVGCHYLLNKTIYLILIQLFNINYILFNFHYFQNSFQNPLNNLQTFMKLFCLSLVNTPIINSNLTTSSNP